MNEELKNKINDKKDSVVRRIKAKGYDILDWIIDHPIQSFAIGFIGVKVGSKIFDERAELRACRDRLTKEWDPESGCYYKVRRPLTNKESKELYRRQRDGERTIDILAQMKLLD